ncbi:MULTISPECIES: MbtH family protein [unclassified Streptomyces]|uniref:MbtH family protein n=1 Tax=unclassified Streptomyces TaxID=2593676 RepID=UPI001BE537FC|nr:MULTISPECIES: MbtH family protein [unclassified Streptomyces]MBT2405481.1 MbtH family protein [Streptomyces sp. ISL-21]MBT2607840.1 MbtH family protein [Streptomyces sp. ISL-87]
MSNPFDNQDGTFLVLVNDEGQHSLWPAFAQRPDGWTVALAEGPREAALAYVEEHWTDMRPASLRAAADAGSATGSATESAA